MDTTLEVVVEGRGKREMKVVAKKGVANTVVANKVIAEKVVGNKVVADKVVAKKVVANTVVANKVVANMVVAGVAFQCLTNFVMLDEEVVEVVLVVEPGLSLV